VSGRAPASTLAHYAHRFVFDLLLIDASVRSALSYTLDRLEANGHGRKVLQKLTIVLARRALAQPDQEVAVDLNRRRRHASRLPAGGKVVAPWRTDWATELGA
jgi:hypothetical protein